MADYKYFKWNEIIASTTAKQLGIDNTPKNDLIIANLHTTLKALDTIREAWGQPIIITSGYRCYELNKAVRGAKTSHHTQGMAVDITTKGKKNNYELYKFIRDNFSYIQVIAEKLKGSDCGWVHFSFSHNIEDNRKEALLFQNGVYTKDPNKKK